MPGMDTSQGQINVCVSFIASNGVEKKFIESTMSTVQVVHFLQIKGCLLDKSQGHIKECVSF